MGLASGEFVPPLFERATPISSARCTLLSSLKLTDRRRSPPSPEFDDSLEVVGASGRAIALDDRTCETRSCLRSSSWSG